MNKTSKESNLGKLTFDQAMSSICFKRNWGSRVRIAWREVLKCSINFGKEKGLMNNHLLVKPWFEFFVLCIILQRMF